MKQLYKLFACTLFAAGACVGAAAQQLPFNESDTYFVKVGNPADGKNGYIHYNPEGNYFDLVTSKWEADPVHFHIAGNEFQLVNIGDGRVTLGVDNSDNGTRPGAAEGNGMQFTLEKKGEALNFRSTIGAKGYLNNYAEQGKLAFWQANGPGSTVVVEKADYQTLYNEAKAQFKRYAENNHLFGTTVGTYSRPGNLQAAMNAYNNPPTQPQKYQEEFNKLRVALRQIHLNMPQAGEFFRIRSTAAGQRFLSIAPGTNGILKVVPTADEQTLFYYDGEHLTAYATGQGLANEANNVKPATLGDAVNRASFAEGRGDGTYLVTTGDRTLLFRGNEEVTRSGMNMPKSWPAQYLDLVPVDEISLHIGETGYATFFAHQAMKLNDSSVKIYVAERNGTNSLQLTELTKGIIPAATAVILKADGAKTLTLSRTDEKGDTEKTAHNVLKGYGYSQRATAGKAVYALALNPENNKVEFGKLDDGVVLPAFKACIESDPAAGNAAPLFIALPTAVQQAKRSTAAPATYDLSGRRVQQTAKGQLYVRNGQKFVQQ